MTHHHDSLDPDHPHRCHCHPHGFPNVDVSCYPTTMPLPFWSNPYPNASIILLLGEIHYQIWRIQKYPSISHKQLEVQFVRKQLWTIFVLGFHIFSFQHLLELCEGFRQLAFGTHPVGRVDFPCQADRTHLRWSWAMDGHGLLCSDFKGSSLGSSCSFVQNDLYFLVTFGVWSFGFGWRDLAIGGQTDRASRLEWRSAHQCEISSDDPKNQSISSNFSKQRSA